MFSRLLFNSFVKAFSIVLIISPVYAQVVLEEREPEAATGVNQKQLKQAESFMVAAANPYASAAGKAIIEKGGSAIDAAVAVQAMLTLVEPQSSGIGGGAFILYWDNENKKLHSFDGREIAPMKAHPDIFIQNDKPMKWRDAVVGGLSVGVPGVIKALEEAHAEFGNLPWETLFESTIDQSREGFVVSQRLARLLEIDLHPGLNQFPSSAEYFKPDGKPLKEGELKVNHKLANTLSQIAKEGSKAFYQGEIAKKIVDAVNKVSINPSNMQLDDLNAYAVIKREPMCNPYRKYTICGMAPPSSGGVSVYQILKSLERFDLEQYTYNSPELVHLFTQASALAFADRAYYIADLAYLNLSPAPLVEQDYIRTRSAKISLDNQMKKAEPGKPDTFAKFAQDNALELDSTSHIAIVDKAGNAISMTSSIEFMFGSGIMVEGFLLNNQLTDFSLDPNRDGKLVLNRVQAHKRPRSSMSPTMVFDENKQLSLVVGSPGGSRIINYVAQTLVNVLDFNMDIQQAIDVPRFSNRNGSTTLEKGTEIVELQDWLEKRGHTVRIGDLNSGIHGVQIKKGQLLGGADPRREGVALGQ